MSDIPENEEGNCETPGVTLVKVTSVNLVEASPGSSNILTPKMSATKILKKAEVISIHFFLLIFVNMLSV